MFSIRPAILTLHVQLLEHGTVYGLWCMRNSRTLRIQYRNYRNGSFEEETNVPVLDPPFWNIAIRDLVFFHFVGLDWVEDLARGKTRAFAPEKKNWSEKRRRMGSFPTTPIGSDTDTNYIDWDGLSIPFSKHNGTPKHWKMMFFSIF